jgi:LPXTG-motif cell wall-anchored protein
MPQQGGAAPASIAIAPPAVGRVAFAGRIGSNGVTGTTGVQAQDSRTRLPQTGSPMPLVSLVGLCLLAAAAALRRSRTVRQDV